MVLHVPAIRLQFFKLQSFKLTTNKSDKIFILFEQFFKNYIKLLM